MGEEWEQLRNKGPAFPPSALSNALVNKGCRLPASGLALSGRLTASSSPKVGALGKGVKFLRNA